TGKGGILRVEIPTGNLSLPAGFGQQTADNIILQTVLALAQRQGRTSVVLVTRDTNMRLKADALGVHAEDYEHAHVVIDEQYSGVATREISSELISEIYAKGALPWPADDTRALYPNQFVVLTSLENPSQTALGRYDQRGERVKLVGRYKEGIWGIFARNKEQLFALELLLDDRIQLVTLDGMAGTGK